MLNRTLWLALMASSLALGPAGLAHAQSSSESTSGQTAESDADDADDDASGNAASNSDAGSSEASTGSQEGSADADDDDDDDDDDDENSSGDMIPPASELDMAPGSEMMPAAALNGDQIGLPPVSLSSQIITPLVIGQGGEPYAVSAKDFVLRAGQPYRWDIVSEGGVEYKWHAPDFFRNVWNNQIVIEDREIHMDGSPAWLEFDTQGPITVQFQTIRPGRYEWYVEGLDDEEHDMKGTITVVP